MIDLGLVVDGHVVSSVFSTYPMQHPAEQCQTAASAKLGRPTPTSRTRREWPLDYRAVRSVASGLKRKVVMIFIAMILRHQARPGSPYRGVAEVARAIGNVASAHLKEYY